MEPRKWVDKTFGSLERFREHLLDEFEFKGDGTLWAKHMKRKVPDGCIYSSGYRVVRVYVGSRTEPYRVRPSRPFLACELVWLVNKRVWPDATVYFKDGDRDNNTIENLTTQKPKRTFDECYRNNRSGIKGVIRPFNADKWRAQWRTPGGYTCYLGLFDSKLEAGLHILAAAQSAGWPAKKLRNYLPLLIKHIK